MKLVIKDYSEGWQQLMLVDEDEVKARANIKKRALNTAYVAFFNLSNIEDDRLDYLSKLTEGNFFADFSNDGVDRLLRDL